MACQGPEGPTEEQVDRAMKLIMEVLKEEFHVEDPMLAPILMRRGPDGELEPMQKDSWISMHPMDQSWHKARGNLRDAVREMLFAQACSDF